jgi:hypothetical protein
LVLAWEKSGLSGQVFAPEEVYNVTLTLILTLTPTLTLTLTAYLKLTKVLTLILTLTLTLTPIVTLTLTLTLTGVFPHYAIPLRLSQRPFPRKIEAG